VAGPRWDPEKDRRNRALKGIGFDEAATVLDDPFVRGWSDETHSFGEARTVFIGLSTIGRLLVVVVAEDRQGTMRVVTARRASKRERHEYETQLLG
jgi:uncharacterized protein